LALRLETLGYELERGNHGQPEVKGYTKEYLEASSPRRGQIKDHLREQGIDGAAAAQNRGPPYARPQAGSNPKEGWRQPAGRFHARCFQGKNVHDALNNAMPGQRKRGIMYLNVE